MPGTWRSDCCPREQASEINNVQMIREIVDSELHFRSMRFAFPDLRRTGHAQ